MADSDDDIMKKLNTLKSQAEQLNEKCKEMKQIPGIKRIAKKCEAELRFILRVGYNLQVIILYCKS